MKSLFKIAILFCCIFTAQANERCYHHHGKKDGKCEVIKKHGKKPHTFSTNLGLTNLDGSSAMFVVNKAGVLYVGTFNGNLYEYSGGTWTNIGGSTSLSTLDGQFVDTIEFNGSNILVGTASGYVWQWNGSSWTSLAGTDIGNTIDDSCIDTVLVVGGVIYIGTDRGNVFKYVSGSWVKLPGSSSFGDDTLDSSSVGTLAKDSLGGIYASTYGGNTSAGGHVFKYASGSWTRLDGSQSDESLDSNPIWAVAVDGLNNRYAGTFGANMFERGILANSWTQLSNTTDSSWILSISFDALNNPYIVTYNGNVWTYNVLLSSWTQLNGSQLDNTLDDSIVWGITYDPLSGYLYAVTNNGNVFVRASGIWTLL